MDKLSFLFVPLFLLLTLVSYSQEKTGGISLSYIGNFNRFYLHMDENYTTPITGTVNRKSILRSPDLFPDKYLEAYQVGFLNRKKSWHDFRFSFVYMPETTKEYTEINIDNAGWQDLDGHTVSKNMEMYLVNMTHIYKLNIIGHFMSINIGFGGGGGVIRWPSYNVEGTDIMFITYYGYPLGGLEFNFGKHVSIWGEYHYQYGKSLSQMDSVTGGDIKWGYRLEGHEVAVGMNFYF